MSESDRAYRLGQFIRQTIRDADKYYSEDVDKAIDALVGMAETEDDVQCAKRYRWLLSGKRTRQGEVLPNTGHRSINRDHLRALMRFDFWGSQEELSARIDQQMKEEL